MPTAARWKTASACCEADAIAFGRAFMANPDLPLRFAKHLQVAASDMATWYSRDAKGYTDYPVAADESLVGV